MLPFRGDTNTEFFTKLGWQSGTTANGDSYIKGGLHQSPSKRDMYYLAFACSMSLANSPDLYISIIMSLPPTNSPPTYNCGIVGQLEKSLMPERRRLSSRTFTVSNGVRREFSILHAVSEKPLVVGTSI